MTFYHHTIKFATDCLVTKQPRDDFLELTILFLGKITQKEARFKAIGPVHHARWISLTSACFENLYVLKAI